MPVVNDFPGLFEQIVDRANALAQQINVPREAVYAYFNNTAHFPTSINELTDFLNKTDPKYGVSRRDPATGAIRPIMPTSRNPDPRLTEHDRGGFNHAITNAEDSEIQRFQQVDASGAVFGGSWNKALNDQHPEWGGKNGFDTGFVLGQGGPVPGAAGGGTGGGTGGGGGAPAGGGAPNFGGQFGGRINDYWNNIFGNTRPPPGVQPTIQPAYGMQPNVGPNLGPGGVSRGTPSTYPGAASSRRPAPSGPRPGAR